MFMGVMLHAQQRGFCVSNDTASTLNFIGPADCSSNYLLGKARPLCYGNSSAESCRRLIAYRLHSISPFRHHLTLAVLGSCVGLAIALAYPSKHRPAFLVSFVICHRSINRLSVSCKTELGIAAEGLEALIKGKGKSKAGRERVFAGNLRIGLDAINQTSATKSF